MDHYTFRLGQVLVIKICLFFNVIFSYLNLKAHHSIFFLFSLFLTHVTLRSKKVKKHFIILANASSLFFVTDALCTYLPTQLLHPIFPLSFLLPSILLFTFPLLLRQQRKNSPFFSNKYRDTSSRDEF